MFPTFQMDTPLMIREITLVNEMDFFFSIYQRCFPWWWVECPLKHWEQFKSLTRIIFQNAPLLYILCYKFYIWERHLELLYAWVTVRPRMYHLDLCLNVFNLMLMRWNIPWRMTYIMMILLWIWLAWIVIKL